MYLEKKEQHKIVISTFGIWRRKHGKQEGVLQKNVAQSGKLFILVEDIGQYLGLFVGAMAEPLF